MSEMAALHPEPDSGALDGDEEELFDEAALRRQVLPAWGWSGRMITDDFCAFQYICVVCYLPISLMAYNISLLVRVLPHEQGWEFVENEGDDAAESDTVDA